MFVLNKFIKHEKLYRAIPNEHPSDIFLQFLIQLGCVFSLKFVDA